jgi:hypothetical protein
MLSSVSVQDQQIFRSKFINRYYNNLYNDIKKTVKDPEALAQHLPHFGPAPEEAKTMSFTGLDNARDEFPSSTVLQKRRAISALNNSVAQRD